MKRTILLMLGILLFTVSKASAQDPDFIRSSATVISPIVISNVSPVQIDAGNNLLGGRFVLVIDNEGSDDLRCGFNNSVTQTTNGFLARTGAPFVLKIASTIPIWCIATGAASVNIALIQGKSI